MAVISHPEGDLLECPLCGSFVLGLQGQVPCPCPPDRRVILVACLACEARLNTPGNCAWHTQQ